MISYFNSSYCIVGFDRQFPLLDFDLKTFLQMPSSDGSQRPRPAEGSQGVRQPRLGHYREPARGPRHLDRPRRGTSVNEFIVLLV